VVTPANFPNCMIGQIQKPIRATSEAFNLGVIGK